MAKYAGFRIHTHHTHNVCMKRNTHKVFSSVITSTKHNIVFGTNWTCCVVFYFLLHKHSWAVQLIVWSQHTWTIHNLVCGKNWTCCVAFNCLLHKHSWAVHLLVWSQHTWTIHNLVCGKNLKYCVAIRVVLHVVLVWEYSWKT